MWHLRSRRQDVVIQKRLARDCIYWLLENRNSVDGFIPEESKQRFFNLVESASLREDDSSCWRSFTKYVAANFDGPESWAEVKKSYYIYRSRKQESNSLIKSMQLPNDIHARLKEIKQRKGITFAELVEILIEHYEDNER